MGASLLHTQNSLICFRVTNSKHMLLDYRKKPLGGNPRNIGDHGQNIERTWGEHANSSQSLVLEIWNPRESPYNNSALKYMTRYLCIHIYPSKGWPITSIVRHIMTILTINGSWFMHAHINICKLKRSCLSMRLNITQNTSTHSLTRSNVRDVFTTNTAMHQRLLY